MEVASWQDWPKLDVKWDDEGPTELRTDRRPKSKLDWFRKQGDSQRISQPHDQAGGARVEVEALDAKPRNATRCACGLDDGHGRKLLAVGLDRRPEARCGERAGVVAGVLLQGLGFRASSSTAHRAEIWARDCT